MQGRHVGFPGGHVHGGASDPWSRCSSSPCFVIGPGGPHGCKGPGRREYVPTGGRLGRLKRRLRPGLHVRPVFHVIP